MRSTLMGKYSRMETEVTAAIEPPDESSEQVDDAKGSSSETV